MADRGSTVDHSGAHTSDRSVGFDSVLSSGREHRTLLLVIPLVLVVVGLFGFGLVSLSRASNLSSQLQVARQQADANAKAVTERDDLLREARASAAVLGEPGQGAAVLAAVDAAARASGVVIAAPAQHALNLFAWGLPPPPAGQAYRVIGAGEDGREQVVGPALTPDNDGRVHQLVREVPEGLARIEVALLPAPAGGAAAQGTGSAAAQGTGAGGEAGASTRTPLLRAQLPGPGDLGVVAAPAPAEGGARRGGAARR